MDSRNPIDDKALAEGCRRGDTEAQRALYERYAGRLMAVCLRYAGDRAAAEDLLHDTFLKVYGSIRRFEYRGPGSLGAWMTRIAVNGALEWLRARNRAPLVDLEATRPQALAEQPDDEEVARVPREVLLGFVAELPEGYRTVFNLYCVEGFSHREIAGMLGIAEKSSSSQLFRARAMLARRIEAYLKSQER